jgi:hypothetical protein
MIKHIVTFKFAGDTITERLERAADAKRSLESLNGAIPQIVSLVVGIDPGISDTHWDAVLYSEFATPADLDIYQAHPEHVRVAAHVGSLTTARSIVDFVTP